MILTSMTNGSEYSVTKNVEPQELKPVIHAKWEKFCDKDGILRYLECSNCGQVSNQILLRYKYCPNCGAKMDKEDKE